MRRGDASGKEQSGDNQVTAAMWSDNDITLFPGESQTLTVTYNSADLKGATPLVSVFGSNVAKFDVVIGGTSGNNHSSPKAPVGAVAVNAVEPARRPSGK